jgi:hypothetical protein
VVNQASNEIVATGETNHVVCDRMGRPKSLPEKYRKYFPLRGARSSRQQRGGTDSGKIPDSSLQHRYSE